MRVLVACEFSGIVRDAFIERGHDAISCDLLPTERPGPHVQGDVRPLLREPWDLVIAHPPCTYLSTARGAPSDDAEAIKSAVDLFRACQMANAPRVAVENPRIYKFVRRIVGEPDFAVHPYHFGDPWKKLTCFWTKGLPPLMRCFSGAQPEIVGYWVQMSGARYKPNGPGHRDPKIRSMFHPGMARAMAEQWGGPASHDTSACSSWRF